MTDYKYSPSTFGFYEVGFNTDIPADAIDVTAEEHTRLFNEVSLVAGARIVPSRSGYPMVLLPPPPSHDEVLRQVEESRKAAYANAQTGSDRLFAEAQRMQMMGLSGWEDVRDAAIARHEEIKLEHPWPKKES